MANEYVIGKLNEIRELMLSALSLSKNTIYQYWIDRALDDKLLSSPEFKSKLLKIMESLDKSYFDVDHTPEMLSEEYFGVNIFTCDLFDYHMGIYDDIKEKVDNIFEEIIPSDCFKEEQKSIVSAIRISLDRELTCNNKLEYKNAFKNKTYVSKNYRDLLDARATLKEDMEVGINLLIQIVQENS